MNPPENNSPTRPFRTVTDGLGKKRKLGLKYEPRNCAVYMPYDPRIEADLARGTSVGVDLSGLLPLERAVWTSDIVDVLTRARQVVRMTVDPVNEAIRILQPDNVRYSQVDEDESPE